MPNGEMQTLTIQGFLYLLSKSSGSMCPKCLLILVRDTIIHAHTFPELMFWWETMVTFFGAWYFSSDYASNSLRTETSTIWAFYPGSFISVPHSEFPLNPLCVIRLSSWDFSKLMGRCGNIKPCIHIWPIPRLTPLLAIFSINVLILLLNPTGIMLPVFFPPHLLCIPFWPYLRVCG